MSEEPKELTIGDVCDVIRPKKSKESHPVLTFKGLHADGSLHLAEVEQGQFAIANNGDIVFTKQGHIAGWAMKKIGIVTNPNPVHVAGTLQVIRPRPGLYSRYLYYWLKRQETYEYVLRELAGRAGITDSVLRAIPIVVVSTRQQEKIVRLLDEAFEGIAIAKANAEKNLQNARALFNTHLDSALMKKEVGWSESTIGETCVIRSGTTVPSNQERPSGDIPYLKVADLNIAGNSRTLVTSTRFLMRKSTKPAQIIPVGASVFPKRGGAILTNKKRLTGVPVCLDLNLMSVTPKQELDSNFLFLWFLKLDLRSIGSGSSIPQINNYDIEPLKITFPNDKARQVAIAAQAEEVFVESDRLASLYVRKLSALQMMENSLLSSAFHGELGVA